MSDLNDLSAQEVITALGLEYLVVVHVLQAAPAAGGHEGARRHHATGSRFEHLHQIGLGKPAAHLAKAHRGHVAGRRVGGEHHKAVGAGHAPAAEGQVAHGHLDLVAALRAFLLGLLGHERRLWLRAGSDARMAS